MARVGGRNAVASWIVGLLCMAIVAVLVWFTIPIAPMILPTIVQSVGDGLRNLSQ